MFEPKAFYEPSTAQVELMEALQRRDLPTFEALLAEPSVDPDHWYGKPYWATCLAVACRERDCEAFVLALLRAGAGTTKYHKTSVSSSSGVEDSPPTKSVPASRRSTFQESHIDKPFLVEPSVLKRTVEMAVNTERRASKIDDLLQAVRDTCVQVENFKQLIENDMRACKEQIQRFEVKLNSIEHAQRRNNSILIQIMDIISSQADRRSTSK
ncbi:uncharacterized protein [Anabrus simplex]|uniref:uncharacterized protein isoform X1 n=1 Tax=Anabrus simplex TaxID=316456 RepID=UPI0034DCDA01